MTKTFPMLHLGQEHADEPQLHAAKIALSFQEEEN